MLVLLSRPLLSIFSYRFECRCLVRPTTDWIQNITDVALNSFIRRRFCRFFYRFIVEPNQFFVYIDFLTAWWTHNQLMGFKCITIVNSSRICGLIFSFIDFLVTTAQCRRRGPPYHPANPIPRPQGDRMRRRFPSGTHWRLHLCPVLLPLRLL